MRCGTCALLVCACACAGALAPNARGSSPRVRIVVIDPTTKRSWDQQGKLGRGAEDLNEYLEMEQLGPGNPPDHYKPAERVVMFVADGIGETGEESLLLESAKLGKPTWYACWQIGEAGAVTAGYMFDCGSAAWSPPLRVGLPTGKPHRFDVRINDKGFGTEDNGIKVSVKLDVPHSDATASVQPYVISVVLPNWLRNTYMSLAAYDASGKKLSDPDLRNESDPDRIFTVHQFPIRTVRVSLSKMQWIDVGRVRLRLAPAAREAGGIRHAPRRH